MRDHTEPLQQPSEKEELQPGKVPLNDNAKENSSTSSAAGDVTFTPPPLPTRNIPPVPPPFVPPASPAVSHTPLPTASTPPSTFHPYVTQPPKAAAKREQDTVSAKSFEKYAPENAEPATLLSDGAGIVQGAESETPVGEGSPLKPATAQENAAKSDEVVVETVPFKTPVTEETPLDHSTAITEAAGNAAFTAAEQPLKPDATPEKVVHDNEAVAETVPIETPASLETPAREGTGATENISKTDLKEHEETTEPPINGQPAALHKYMPPAYPPPPEAPPVHPYVQQPVPAQKEPERKSRRVGTITMALCLIVTGLGLLLHIFVPGIDIVGIAKFAPVVLVILGVEILVSGIRHRDEKLRYDVLSIIICLVLIAGSLVAAVVPQLIEREIVGTDVEHRLSLELEDLTYEAIEAQGWPVQSVQWDIMLHGNNIDADMQLSELKPTDTIQVWITLDEDFNNENTFAALSHQTLQRFQPFVEHIDYAEIYSKNYNSNIYREGDMRFSVWLNSRHEMSIQPEELATRTLVEYWVPEGYFADMYDYQEYLHEQQNPDSDSFDADEDEIDDVYEQTQAASAA